MTAHAECGSEKTEITVQNIPTFIHDESNYSGSDYLIVIPKQNKSGREIQSITVTWYDYQHQGKPSSANLKPGKYLASVVSTITCVHGEISDSGTGGHSWFFEGLTPDFSNPIFDSGGGHGSNDAVLSFEKINYAPDTTKPVITSPGDSTIEQGEAFDAMNGVTASDDVDGDITSNVKVTGAVDSNTLGSYTLKYDVSDSSGNKADTVTRVITVVKPYLKQMPTTGSPVKPWLLVMILAVMAGGLSMVRLP